MGVAYAMVYQKVRKGSTVTRVMRPEDGRVLLPEGTYPPIVSAEVWHAVQNRLTQNKLQASRNNRHPESALLRGGFVACAECGSNMIAENRPGDYADYLCVRTPWNRGVCGHPRMRAAILDERVWRLLCRILARPETVTQELHRRYANSDAALLKDLASYTKILTDLQDSERAGVAMALKAADDVQRGVIQSQLAQLATQRQAAQAVVNQAQRRLNNQQHLVANLGASAGQLQRLSSRLNTATWQDKRKAVQTLVKQVRIWPARHNTEYRWEITIQIPKFVPLEVEEGIVLGFDETTMSV
jgi:hypothetical protein